MVRSGFGRTNLFQQVEKGFDELFNYDRPIDESFEYYNTMKNSSITDQISMQEFNLTIQEKHEHIQSNNNIYLFIPEIHDENLEEFRRIEKR